MDEFKYRSEDCYGSGVREIKAVIAYETSELGNSDIWEYCLEHYQLSSRTRELAADILSTLDDGGCLYELLDDAIDSLILDLTSSFGFEPRFCLWLSDYDSVSYYYGKPTTKCQPSSAILSDLEDEGTLYAYFNEPEELELEEPEPAFSLNNS